MAITRKIGEVFTARGKRLRVKESGVWYSCAGCAFNVRSHPSISCYEDGAALLEETGECNGAVRKDGKYVIFAPCHETD